MKSPICEKPKEASIKYSLSWEGAEKLKQARDSSWRLHQKCDFYPSLPETGNPALGTHKNPAGWQAHTSIIFHQRDRSSRAIPSSAAQGKVSLLYP